MSGSRVREPAGRTGRLLEVEGNSKRDGDSFALDIERLVVRPGKRLCLPGPSGSGKSILLRFVAGL